MGMPKSNKQLQLEVREALALEVAVDSHAIGITTDHGLVFLSGHVLGATERRAAEEASMRVDGVRAVIDELKIRPALSGSSDADLACMATGSLRQLVGLPDGRVKVVIRDGKVRLKGVVPDPGVKAAIGATVRGAIGRDTVLDNAISVDPGACILPIAEGQSSPPLQDERPLDVLPAEVIARVVMDGSFPDEGVPMKSTHHRDFPEIRGHGETTLQSVLRLAHQLERAREHAGEPWQKAVIEKAIREVKAYHAALPGEAEGVSGSGRPEAVRGELHPINSQAIGVAI